MNRSVYIIISCVGLFIIGIIYYYTKTEIPRILPIEIKNTTKSVNLTLDGTSIFEEVDGHLNWELKAETIIIDPTTKMARLNNIKGSVYPEIGGKVEFTARIAVVEPTRHDIEMEGEFNAVASDGGKFSSDKACYFTKDKHFSATGKVKVTKDYTVITGEKMESDENMTNIKIMGNAKVVKGGEVSAN